MRTYHPIQWAEAIHWHDVFADKRFWAGVAIVVFIALLTLLTVIAVKTGATPGMQYYYGPWPYGGPYVPYGPMPMK